MNTAISENVIAMMVADFLGTLERGLERTHAILDVADDVLQHDDSVVDDEADGQGQRQHCHVVD
jgi:hypothetical protein